MKNFLERKISENAISLSEFGLQEFAWGKEAALQLVRSLLDEDVGILGGDVYEIKQEHLTPLYDNWSCEPEQSETKEDYIYRSKAVALSYISQYHIPAEEKVVFTMTFIEKSQLS